MAKIAVVGAGLIGRLTALSLVRQGYQITLFDKDNKQATQSAAYAAAGLLTPLGESLHCEANIVEMGIISLNLWPELIATLQAQVDFQQRGALMISHQQDYGEYQRLTRHLSKFFGQHDMRLLNQTQLFQLEPQLSQRFNQGAYLPIEGQIDNRILLAALKLELEHHQVNWFSQSTVTEFTNSAGYCALTANGQVHKFDLVIDARGTGARTEESSNKAQPLSDLRAVRGELFHLFAPEVELTRPIRLMHPRYQLYIAPKANNTYVIGATELESDSREPVTVRSALELLSAAYSVHPGFSEAHIHQHISQLRPAFSNNQPQIRCENRLIQVNGLYRHGYLISPIVVKQVEAAVQQTLESHSSSSQIVDLSPYSALMPISYNHASTQLKSSIVNKVSS